MGRDTQPSGSGRVDAVAPEKRRTPEFTTTAVWWRAPEPEPPFSSHETRATFRVETTGSTATRSRPGGKRGEVSFTPYCSNRALPRGGNGMGQRRCHSEPTETGRELAPPERAAAPVPPSPGGMPRRGPTTVPRQGTQWGGPIHPPTNWDQRHQDTSRGGVERAYGTWGRGQPARTP